MFLKYYPSITVFFTGAVIMMLEMAGFRLFAPYFGYSTYVWGSLLGVVMLAMAAGYYFGGWLADNKGVLQALYWVIFLASCYTLGIYFFSSLLLPQLVRLDITVASLLASLIIFGVPMFFLSMTAPFLIGVLATTGHVGITAGSIYGLSTIGSIVGTFLSSFYLIPAFGTKITLLCCFVTLIAIAFFGVLHWTKKACFFLLILPLMWVSPSDAERALLTREGDILFDRDSNYSRVLVIEDTKFQRVSLKSGHLGSQSYFIRGRLLTGGYLDYFNLGPLLNHDTNSFLLLGVSGGIVTKQLHHFFPALEIDGVEIDPVMLEAAEQYFDLVRADNIQYYIADARPFIETIEKKYDIIGVDLYQGIGSIPFYVTTQEFFQATKRQLQPNGFTIVNVSDVSQNKLVAKPVINTIASVYPTVFRIKINIFNDIIIASHQPMTLNEFKVQLLIDKADKFAMLAPILNSVRKSVEIIKFQTNELVLTDDLTPIESLHYQAYAEFRKTFGNLLFH